jgi:predicted nucleic acid-binding protein
VATEPHAARVKRLCARTAGNVLLIAQNASVEVASAFGRRAREGRWQTASGSRAWRLFLSHRLAQYRVVPLTEGVYSLAEELVFRHPLRAADALHVSCAVLGQTTAGLAGLVFMTGDRQQARAAAAEGVAVELLQ